MKWKKNYFFLRRRGLYYSPSSTFYRHLESITCIVMFVNVFRLFPAFALYVVCLLTLHQLKSQREREWLGPFLCLVHVRCGQYKTIELGVDWKSTKRASKEIKIKRTPAFCVYVGIRLANVIDCCVLYKYIYNVIFYISSFPFFIPLEEKENIHLFKEKENTLPIPIL